MFESQTGKWTFTNGDEYDEEGGGFAFKFHKDVLAAHVPHFRTIFSHKETAECRNKKIEIPAELKMNKQDAEAFLRYVYYQDVTAMTASCSTTCRIIKAGHYYNVPKMVVSGWQLLNQKRVLQNAWSWFNVDEMWKLYHHVRLREETYKFKDEVLQGIIGCMKGIFKNEEDTDKLLTITDGNHALRDMMVGFAK